MSMQQVKGTENEEKEERGRGEVCLEEKQCLDNSDTPAYTQLGSNLRQCDGTTETSLSPSGLLALPWEMVARIASHLPAQCVINVLPQVCRALGQVGEDMSAWQIRAQRLTGSQSSFPVGPRNHFDWPTACLEMEKLIECWARQKETAETPEPRIEIQEQVDQDEVVQQGEAAANGEEREADAERQPAHVEEEIRPEGEENPEIQGGEEEQRNNVIVIREEGRENQERLQEQEDSGLQLVSSPALLALHPSSTLVICSIRCLELFVTFLLPFYPNSFIFTSQHGLPAPPG
ncbi:F-box/WD repeat-containing protein 9 isoform X1 [Tachysurus ichikawai]